MEFWGNILLESLCDNIGRTVTIFTTSGGISGSGFTGVLLSADREVVRLLCQVGGSPACPIGSCCGGPPPMPCNDGGFCGSLLGAIAVIPLHAVACFTQNAI